MPIQITAPSGRVYTYPDEVGEAEAIQRSRIAEGEDIASDRLGGIENFPALAQLGIANLVRGSLGGLGSLVGANEYAREQRRILEDAQAYYQAQLSPGFARDREREGIQYGDVAGVLFENTIPTLGTLGVGVGAQLGARALGAAAPLAARVGATGAMATEGALAAGGLEMSNFQQVLDIARANPDAFFGSEIGQRALRAAIDEGTPEDQVGIRAVQIAAREQAGILPVATGVGTALLGGVFGDRIVGGLGPQLQRLIPRPVATAVGAAVPRGVQAVARPILGTAASESVEEMAQSGIEQLAANQALSNVRFQTGLDPNIFQDVPESVILGGVAGGIGGGLFGAGQAAYDAGAGLVNRIRQAGADRSSFYTGVPDEEGLTPQAEQESDFDFNLRYYRGLADYLADKVPDEEKANVGVLRSALNRPLDQETANDLFGVLSTYGAVYPDLGRQYEESFFQREAAAQSAAEAAPDRPEAQPARREEPPSPPSGLLEDAQLFVSQVQDVLEQPDIRDAVNAKLDQYISDGGGLEAFRAQEPDLYQSVFRAAQDDDVISLAGANDPLMLRVAAWAESAGGAQPGSARPGPPPSPPRPPAPSPRARERARPVEREAPTGPQVFDDSGNMTDVGREFLRNEILSGRAEPNSLYVERNYVPASVRENREANVTAFNRTYDLFKSMEGQGELEKVGFGWQLKSPESAPSPPPTPASDAAPKRRSVMEETSAFAERQPTRVEGLAPSRVPITPARVDEIYNSIEAVYPEEPDNVEQKSAYEAALKAIDIGELTAARDFSRSQETTDAAGRTSSGPKTTTLQTAFRDRMRLDRRAQSVQPQRTVAAGPVVTQAQAPLPSLKQDFADRIALYDGAENKRTAGSDIVTLAREVAEDTGVSLDLPPQVRQQPKAARAWLDANFNWQGKKGRGGLSEDIFAPRPASPVGGSDISGGGAREAFAGSAIDARDYAVENDFASYIDAQRSLKHRPAFTEAEYRAITSPNDAEADAFIEALSGVPQQNRALRIREKYQNEVLAAISGPGTKFAGFLDRIPEGQRGDVERIRREALADKREAGSDVATPASEARAAEVAAEGEAVARTAASIQEDADRIVRAFFDQGDDIDEDLAYARVTATDQDGVVISPKDESGAANRLFDLVQTVSGRPESVTLEVGAVATQASRPPSLQDVASPEAVAAIEDIINNKNKNFDAFTQPRAISNQLRVFVRNLGLKEDESADIIAAVGSDLLGSNPDLARSILENYLSSGIPERSAGKIRRVLKRIPQKQPVLFMVGDNPPSRFLPDDHRDVLIAALLNDALDLTRVLSGTPYRTGGGASRLRDPTTGKTYTYEREAFDALNKLVAFKETMSLLPPEGRQEAYKKIDDARKNGAVSDKAFASLLDVYRSMSLIPAEYTPGVESQVGAAPLRLNPVDKVIDAVQKRLRAELDRIGLNDVQVRFGHPEGLEVESMATAYYDEQIITILTTDLDMTAPMNAIMSQAIYRLHGELFHALMHVGVVTKKERDALVKFTKAYRVVPDATRTFGVGFKKIRPGEKSMYDSITEVRAYSRQANKWSARRGSKKLARMLFEEEAITFAFREWAKMKTQGKPLIVPDEPKTVFDKIFNYIKAVISSMRLVPGGSRGLFSNADDVFQSVMSGAMGARDRSAFDALETSVIRQLDGPFTRPVGNIARAQAGESLAVQMASAVPEARPDMREPIRQFLESKKIYGHFTAGPFSVGFRTSKRIGPAHRKSILVLDLMTIASQDPRERTGRFRELLVAMEIEAGNAGFEAVYVESVMNRDIRPTLVAMGYVRDPLSSDEAPNYSKIFDSDSFLLMAGRRGSPPEVSSANRLGYRGTNAVEANEWSQAVAKGLDMSLEARMERARAMGFDTSRVWYHGVDMLDYGNDYPKTILRKNPGLALSGPGFYVSRGRDGGVGLAVHYSTGVGGIVPVFLRGTLVPYMGRNGSPLDSAVDWEPDEEAGETGIIYSRGVDSVAGRYENAVVRVPSAVRSVHAAFDPDMIDEPNIMLMASSRHGYEGSDPSEANAFSATWNKVYQRFLDGNPPELLTKEGRRQAGQLPPEGQRDQDGAAARAYANAYLSRPERMARAKARGFVHEGAHTVKPVSTRNEEFYRALYQATSQGRRYMELEEKSYQGGLSDNEDRERRSLREDLDMMAVPQFEAFDVSRTGQATDAGFYGPAIYIQSMNFAESSFREIGGYSYGSVALGGYNIPVLFRMLNPFVHREVRDRDGRYKKSPETQAMFDALDDSIYPYDFSPAQQLGQPGNTLSLSELGQRFAAALNKAGFDGVINTSRPFVQGERIDEMAEIVIFDPRNIRSVHAAFDPDHSDESNLLMMAQGRADRRRLPEVRSALGSYSQAEEVLLNISRQRGNGQAWLNEFKRQGMSETALQGIFPKNFAKRQVVQRREVMGLIANAPQLRRSDMQRPLPAISKRISRILQRIAEDIEWSVTALSPGGIYEFSIPNVAPFLHGLRIYVGDLTSSLINIVGRRELEFITDYREYALRGGRDYRESVYSVDDQGVNSYKDDHWPIEGYVFHTRSQKWPFGRLVEETQSLADRRGPRNNQEVEMLRAQLRKADADLLAASKARTDAFAELKSINPTIRDESDTHFIFLDKNKFIKDSSGTVNLSMYDVEKLQENYKSVTREFLDARNRFFSIKSQLDGALNAVPDFLLDDWQRVAVLAEIQRAALEGENGIWFTTSQVKNGEVKTRENRDALEVEGDDGRQLYDRIIPAQLKRAAASYGAVYSERVVSVKDAEGKPKRIVVRGFAINDEVRARITRRSFALMMASSRPPRLQSGFTSNAGSVVNKARVRGVQSIKPEKRAVQDLGIGEEEYEILEIDNFLAPYRERQEKTVSIQDLETWIEGHQYDVTTHVGKRTDLVMTSALTGQETQAMYGGYTPFTTDPQDNVEAYVEGSVQYKTGTNSQLAFRDHGFPPGTFVFYQAVVLRADDDKREMVITTVQSDFFDKSRRDITVSSEEERAQKIQEQRDRAKILESSRVFALSDYRDELQTQSNSILQGYADKYKKLNADWRNKLEDVERKKNELRKKNSDFVSEQVKEQAEAVSSFEAEARKRAEDVLAPAREAMQAAKDEAEKEYNEAIKPYEEKRKEVMDRYYELSRALNDAESDAYYIPGEAGVLARNYIDTLFVELDRAYMTYVRPVEDEYFDALKRFERELLKKIKDAQAAFDAIGSSTLAAVAEEILPHVEALRAAEARAYDFIKNQNKDLEEELEREYKDVQAQRDKEFDELQKSEFKQMRGLRSRVYRSALGVLENLTEFDVQQFGEKIRSFKENMSVDNENIFMERDNENISRARENFEDILWEVDSIKHEIDYKIGVFERALNVGSVPFSKSHNKVALKQALIHASELGVDRISIIDRETLRIVPGLSGYRGKLYDYTDDDGKRQRGILTNILAKLVGDKTGTRFSHALSPLANLNRTEATGTAFSLSLEKRQAILQEGLPLMMASSRAPRTAFAAPPLLPAENMIGQDARQVVLRHMNSMSDPTAVPQTSKQMAIGIANLAEKMRQSENPLVDVAGRVLDATFTLGNLPGQNLFIGLRARAAGQIQLANEYRERLIRLRRTMSETDLEQYKQFMMTRKADPMLIEREDVREAAIVTKRILNNLGAENVRVGQMSKRQYDMYQDRYLPRAYWRYIEKELRGIGIKLGQGSYLKQRGGSSDQRLIATAVDNVGRADDVELMRRDLTEMLSGIPEKAHTDLILFFRTGSTPFVDAAITMIPGGAPSGWRDRLIGMQRTIKSIQDTIDAEGFITKQPVFHKTDPKTGQPLTKAQQIFLGPKAFEDRYGAGYLGREFFKAAVNDISIGALYEQGAIDGLIQDPILLSLKAISVQTRDMAVNQFFDQIFEVESALNDYYSAGGVTNGKPIRWIVPGTMIKYKNKIYSLDKFQEALELLRNHNLALKEGSLQRAISDEMLAEMEAIYQREFKVATAESKENYQKLPDTPAYGSLAGAFVHKAIYKDLKGSLGDVNFGEGNDFSAMQDSFMNNLGSFFKQTKTTLNIPAGHARALMGNLQNAYMAGVGNSVLGTVLGGLATLPVGGAGFIFAPALSTLPAYIDAVKAMQSNSPDWLDALEMGVRQGTFTAIELRQALSAIEEIRQEEVSKAQGGNIEALNRISQKLFRAVDGAFGSAADVYNFWDTTARFMIYRDLVKKGMGKGDAMAEAYQWMPDYGIVPDWVRAMRNNFAGVLVAPFLTYSVKMGPVFFDQIGKMVDPRNGYSIAKRADTALRMAPFFALTSGLANVITMMLMGLTDEEAEGFHETVVEAFRDNPTRVVFNWKDSQNDYLQSSLEWMFAWGGFVHAGVETAKGDVIGALEKAFSFGSPFYNIGVVAATGIDPFSQQGLWDENDSAQTRLATTIKYAFDQLFLPPMLSGVLDPLWSVAGANTKTYQGPLSLALDKAFGDTQQNSGKYVGDWSQITARFGGINLTSHDPVERYERERARYRGQVTSLRREISSERRMVVRDSNEIFARRGLSQAEKNRLIAQREAEFESFRADRLEKIELLREEWGQREAVMTPILERLSAEMMPLETPEEQALD